MDWEWLESRATVWLSLAAVLGLAWWILRADSRRRSGPAPPRAESRTPGRRGPAARKLDLALSLLVGGALLRWGAGERFPLAATFALLATGAGMVAMGIYLECRIEPGRREENPAGGATSSPRSPKGARPSSPSGTP